jgi:PTH1 family peptidyl-tRNA hydrolase
LREELKEWNVSEWELSKKFNAEICGATVRGDKIILAKPMTFMNESGIAVQLIAHFYKMTHRDIIVVHDDKDITLGEIKVQTDRSSAGHNGVQSIINHIGTQDFTRVRIGIKSENENKMKDASKFVLSKFGLFERKKVKETMDRTVKEILKIV